MNLSSSKGIKHQIALKQAEMRTLKLEESTLNTLAAEIQDQLNRLKVEEMGLSGCITDRNVKNAIQTSSTAKAIATMVPSLNAYEIIQQQKSMMHQGMTSSRGQSSEMQYEPGSSLADLDLDIPPTHAIQAVYDDEESSDNEDEECLLAL